MSVTPLPTPEMAAKEILRFAVRELKVTAGSIIQAEPVVALFNSPPWRAGDVGQGLVFAQVKGWITEDGKLTAKGFAVAP